MNALLQLDGVAWWHVAGWTMLHYLWMGALVGVAALVSRVALRRASANVRYAAALACLAVLATLPVGIGIGVGQKLGVRDQVSGVMGTAELTSTPANETPAAPAGQQVAKTAGNVVELKRERGPVETALVDDPAPLEITNPDSNPRPTTFNKQRGLPAVPAAVAEYLPWVWIVGAPLTLLLLTTGVVGAERLRRQSRVLQDGPVVEAAARLAESLQIGRMVTIAVCERIAAPVLVGIVRPMILLPPAALTGWSPDEIEMVLLHELAHVRRWDNLVNLAQRLVEAVLFFQPAVWLVSNWVRREREACCDAVVVGRTNRPHAYAELLVALASQLPRSVLFHPAASSAMAAGPLRGRIRRILGIEDDPLLISGKSLGVVMSGLLLAATLVVLSVTTNTQAKEEGFTTESTEGTEKEIDAAKKRAATQNNLKDLAIGLLNYQDALKNFPPRAKFDADGKPLLSWRVLVLPYLSRAYLNPDSEEAKLYAEFHLDEPWDSEHNRQLIARMPAVFKNPQIDKPGFTNYLAVVGRECMFDDAGKPVRIAQVADGTSNTISIVEADADRAVEWTKPEDWEFDREHPTAGLGGMWPGRWYAAWVDGHISHVSSKEQPDHVGIQFTRAGGETDSLVESAGRGSEMVATDEGMHRDMVGEMGLGVAGELTAENAEGTEKSEGKSRQEDTARLRQLFKVDRANSKQTEHYSLRPDQRDAVEGLIDGLTRDAYGPQVEIEHRWLDGNARIEIVAPQRAHREFFTEVFNKLSEEAAVQSDNWPAGVGFPSPEEGEISRRAWQKLGLKLVPATNEERTKAGTLQGVKVVGGIPREAVPGKPEPLILVGLNGLPFNKFSDVAQALDELERRPNPILTCMMASNGNVVVFQKVLGADLSKMQRESVFKVTNDENEILFREIIGLYRSKRELESQLSELQSNFHSMENAAAPQDKSKSQLRKEFQIRAGVLQNQLAATTEAWREKSEELRRIGGPAGDLKVVADDMTDSTANHPNIAPVAASRFPSLEEQKLADVAWDMLGLELESIDETELRRVQNQGYEGGLRIAAARRPMGISKDFVPFEFTEGDILVGLHVWPSKSLHDVAAILQRDDLKELSPLKFYIVRPGTGPNTGGFSREDRVISGRIEVAFPETKKTESSNSNRRSATKSLPPGMKELREERVDPETGRTQTIITVIPESQPSSPAPRPTLPPAATKPQPTHEPIPIPPLSDAEKAALLQGGPFTLEFYYSPDSQPCRDAAKLIAEYQTAFPGFFEVERIDVVADPARAVREGLRRVPMLKLQRDREFVDETTGAWSLPELTKIVTEYARRRPTLLPKEMLEVMRVQELEARAQRNSKKGLRYDGKTFDEWRSAWKTELSMENRLEAVKALAAFGANGQGKAAAEAIMEVAQQQDWAWIDRKSSAGKLKQACVDAFTTGETTGGYRIPAEDWFPLVKPLIAKQGDKFNFATYIQVPRGEKVLIPELVELTKDPATKNWGTWGLKNVDPAFEDERTLAFFLQRLQETEDNSQELAIALRNFLYSPSGSIFSVGQPDTKLRYLPELDEYLFHPDEQVQQSARYVFAWIQPEDAKAVVAKLLKIVEEKKGVEQLSAIRALAAMGPKAGTAEESLLRIARERAADKAETDNAFFASVAASLLISDATVENWDVTTCERIFGSDEWGKYGQPWFKKRLRHEEQQLFPPDVKQKLGGGGGMF